MAQKNWEKLPRFDANKASEQASFLREAKTWSTLGKKKERLRVARNIMASCNS